MKGHVTTSWAWLLAWLLPALALAHEIPTDVTVRLIVRPDGDRVHVLVRAPLEAMQDITFPTVGAGFLDVANATPRLRDAAQIWLKDNIEVYENGVRIAPLEIAAVRASIPSDRSFDDYETARAHVRGPPIPAGTPLVWQQALLDVELEAPIQSSSSLFGLRLKLDRLGLRVVNAVRFIGPGVERVYRIEGDAGVVPLDPRWHQSLGRFLALGFEHILDGLDHLLFLLCLVVPLRRDLRRLVLIVTAFTAGHSVTLIGSAFGLAPSALWFPPLVETAIALSILYMAVENVVAARVRARAAIAFAFGLVHGFGFSFALTSTLQFAGDHLLTSLLAFNVGIELGQLLVLVALIPALNLLFRFVDARVGGIVIAVLVGHTAWHWLAERFENLRAFWV